tara:strand:- start:845 stop:3472 length:2628 start_codon:yes stop_codon:yes gene_type:complete
MDSRNIFELRNVAKELVGVSKYKKLKEAFLLAEKLNKEDPQDEWVIKAYAWVAIDICKYLISIDNFDRASSIFKVIENINLVDDIFESQKKYLKPKIDRKYIYIKKADDFSKDKKHQEAFKIYEKLNENQNLPTKYHESFGWVIYRYLSSEYKEMDYKDVKVYLNKYLKLDSSPPSMLHSMILHFALNYSKNTEDFDLYKFFQIWGMTNLRSEDKNKGDFDGKDIPSLISRVLSEIINSQVSFDLDEILKNVPDLKVKEYSYSNQIDEKEVLDILRESYFWLIFNTNKSGKHNQTWNFFDEYIKKFSIYETTKWHSEILSLAERYMSDDNEWRFNSFFKSWNITSFSPDDWKEKVKNEYTIKPLAIKALKKSFKVLKSNNFNEDFSWLVEMYENLPEHEQNNEDLLREKAILYSKSGSIEESIKVFKELVLVQGDKYYVWDEFSECLSEEYHKEKIGMIANSLLLEKNEDFIGSIRLKMADLLIKESKLENALYELQKYKKHRALKGWKISERYNEILIKTEGISESNSNLDLYNEYKIFAEEFAFSDIEWTSLTLIDIWKDKKDKKRYKFSNGKDISVSISSIRINSKKNLEIGVVIDFKLNVKEIKEEISQNSLYRFSLLNKKKTTIYISLINRESEKSKWEGFEDEVVVVDYINQEKNVLHLITSKDEEVFHKTDVKNYQTNNFYKCKRYNVSNKESSWLEVTDLNIIQKEEGLKSFSNAIGVVDSVNDEKKLFHVVISNFIHMTVLFRNTEIIPKIGQFLQLSYFRKKDTKKGGYFFRCLSVSKTNETKNDLVKQVTGELMLKYRKEGLTSDFHDLNEEEQNVLSPDFAFVDDIYIPKYLLDKNYISDNCPVSVKAIISKGKWRVFELNVL